MIAKSATRLLNLSLQYALQLFVESLSMTTLHALRRTYALSFSELALLTAVPARRLAEFEYHGCPLSAAERQSLAAFFGIAAHGLEGGYVARVAAYPALTRAQAQTLAALAATAVLAWSLRIAPTLPLTTLFQFRAANETRAALAVVQNMPNATSTPSPSPATATPARTETTRRSPGAAVPPALADPVDDPAPIKAIIKATRGPTPTRAPTLTPDPTAVVPAPASLTTASTVAQQQFPQNQIDLVQITGAASAPGQCPIVPDRGEVIVTQGYGIGTHAPANVWGALDLVVAEGTTAGTPVVATHAGAVTVTLNSWPGGNFVSIRSESGWRTAYAHLETVAVQSGEYVAAGAVIGTVGSTGQTSGPHLHYETWQGGVNVDPSPHLFCE